MSGAFGAGHLVRNPSSPVYPGWGQCASDRWLRLLSVISLAILSVVCDSRDRDPADQSLPRPSLRYPSSVLRPKRW
ncbi:MAG: hypothetical protein ABI895_38830 [Deltaproteobacteria bacterium]